MKRQQHDHYGAAPALAVDFGLFAVESIALPEPPLTPTRTTTVRAHRRTLEGPPLPSEAERRDEVLQSFEDGPASRRALVYVRAKLLELYRSRRLTNPQCYVTADDAHDILDAWADYPRDDLPSNNWRGSIFRGSHWKRTGETIESKRNHGTALPCWAVVGDVRWSGCGECAMTRPVEMETRAVSPPWGVFDTVDQCWLGTNDDGTGPRTHDDEGVAMCARDMWQARFEYPDGRLDLRRFMPSDAADVRLKDEVEPARSYDDAVRSLGWFEGEISL